MKAARQVPLVVRTQTISVENESDFARYREKIPVLLIDGGEAFRYRASAREIIDAVKKAET